MQDQAGTMFLIQDALVNVETAAAALQRYVTVGDEAPVAGDEALLSEIRGYTAGGLDAIEQAIAQEESRGNTLQVQRLQLISSQAVSLIDGVEQIIALRQNGSAQEAAAALEGAVFPFRLFEDSLREAAATEAEGLADLRDRADRAGDIALWLLVISGAVGGVLGLAAAAFITRSIIKPLTSLEAAAVAVSEGDLQARAQTAGPQELARLGASLNTMTESLLDASKRRELEEEIRRREQYFRSLIENASDLVVVLNDDLTIRYISPSVKSTLGFEPEDLIGSRPLSRLVHSDDLASAGRSFTSATENPHVAESLEARLRHRDGSWHAFEGTLRNLRDDPAVAGFVLNCRDVTESKRADEELRVRARQQSTAAELGQRALAGTGLSTLMDDAVVLLAEALDVEYCKVLELLPDGEALVLRAGVGWEEGLVGRATVGIESDSQAGYTLLSNEPVVVEDLRTERRFRGPTLLFDHQVISGLSVVIPGADRPFGVLGVHTSKQRKFCEDDIHFLQAAANVLAAAIQRTRTEEALRESERLLLESQSVAQVGSYVLDIPSGTWESSPVLDSIFGIDQEYERSVEGWLAIVHPDVRQSMADYFAHDVLEGHARFNREYRIVRLDDGAERWVLGLGELQLDEGGRPVKMVGTIQDITHRKQAEEAAQHLAYHDALTGLPNRTLFKDRLNLALAQAGRNGQAVAVMFIDLDHFKVVNDTVGHAAGDRLLRSAAERLTNLVREGDTVARLGGDEFTVLLPDVAGIEDATEVARRIIEVCRRPWDIAGQEFRATASIGIAMYPDDGDDAESLLRKADTAMYRAKEQGRDNHQTFTTAMDTTVVERLELESSLRRGLERGEFLVHYQPQINLHSGAIVGVEALVRWQRPERGLVFPKEFIPAAEETGLIVPLGIWVLRAACAQNVAWQRAGHAPLPIAVNLSARQFQQRDLLAMVRQVLNETEMDPQYLQLEITEGAAMQDAETTAVTLHALREMGIQIALDDFGTGHSSLSYLRSFPVSTLKIDHSFVRDLMIDPNDATITATILAMATSLRLRVIAEGVETEDQLAFLKEHGCDQAQGFLFSRPLPAGEFEEMLGREGHASAARQPQGTNR